MKFIIDWLLAQRQRIIIVAVVAAPLLPLLSAALLALDTARRGIVQGVVSALFALGGLLGIAALSRTSLSMFALIGLISFGSGVAVGALLRRAGNLALAFQSTVLLSLVAVAVIALVGPDTHALFGPALNEFAEVLRAGGASDDQIAVVMGRSGVVLLAAAVFAQLIGALLLGYWWNTLAAGERRFGAEFRALALGRVLGTIASVLLVLGLVFDAQLVQNLAPLAMLAFLVQGLAVVQAWAHLRRWHPALVAPLYAMLVVPPLTVLVLLPLSFVGLVDNWFNLRARWRPRS